MKMGGKETTRIERLKRELYTGIQETCAKRDRAGEKKKKAARGGNVGGD